ncbi:MAG TPA: hypothetical protein VK688_05700 [Gemmatimonadales bacterium]|nr:hypothetical protein [Gemmatimonadales bacterium]
MDSERSLLPGPGTRLARRIFRAAAAATTAGLLACASAPLNGPKAPTPTTGDPKRTYALPQVYLLQMSDPPVPDTTVRVRRGVPRVIVLRHAAPDDLTFAELDLPAAAFDTTRGDSVDITIHPRPGLYGVDLTTSATLKSATLTFKYAVHFKAPDDARAALGSDVAFERLLAIGKLGSGETIAFQRSSRPAADNLSAELTSAGSYIVGAPK